jgi:hypothetical protein
MTLSSLIASRVQVDMGQASSSAPDFVKNKPALGTAASSDTSAFDAAGAATAAQSAAASDATTKANAAQAAAMQRANHTGTQLASTISDFSAAALLAVTWSTLTGKPTVPTVDSGWTANNTVGDKTAALSSYSNGLNATMITALNVVSGGTGTAIGAAFDVLVIVVKKLAAIETALSAGKLPNQ